MRPRKITLLQCAIQRDYKLILYCEGRRKGGRNGRCWHSGEMLLSEAIERWGRRIRLDQIPAVCSRCGSREVNVRARQRRRIGGHACGEFDPDD